MTSRPVVVSRVREAGDYWLKVVGRDFGEDGLALEDDVGTWAPEEEVLMIIASAGAVAMATMEACIDGRWNLCPPVYIRVWESVVDYSSVVAGNSGIKRGALLAEGASLAAALLAKSTAVSLAKSTAVSLAKSTAASFAKSAAVVRRRLLSRVFVGLFSVEDPKIELLGLFSSYSGGSRGRIWPRPSS